MLRLFRTGRGRLRILLLLIYRWGWGLGRLRLVPLRGPIAIAKYNQLLRIEEELGAAAKFPGRAALTK